MAATSEQQCSKWLKENCFVNVKKEWLDACIEFLKQEHRGFSSQTQLNNLVYEQLLMADFQEISLGTLPTFSTGKSVSTLQGKHTLQINSIIDVGQSAYSQIQKLKGEDDLENQKENTNNNNWEPKIKPSRMLFLHMTDGSKSIQAMEYQSIPGLNKSTAPGTKVQIQGPVSCRLGVLLLASKNIRILGGTVEELVETNSMWNVLHNAIGQAAPELLTCSNYIKEETDNHENTPSLQHTDMNGNSMHDGRQLGPNNNAYQQRNASNNSSVARPSVTKRRSSNSGQKEKSSQASTGRITMGQNSNKRPFSSCSNRGVRNNNNIDMDGFDVDDDFFDENGDENFDFDQLDQIEQEVIDNNAFDDNLDENLDFDQIDQIEQEVIQNSKSNTNSKPDQRVHSPYTENEFFDEDFIDEDFDDFDMDQSRIAFPKMDSGHKKYNMAFKTENFQKQSATEKNGLPMAKKLKTAMHSPETNTITSNACISTKRRGDSTDCTGSSFMNNYGKVGPSESEKLTAQSNKTTGKLNLKKLNKNPHQTTINFDTHKSWSGFKKDDRSSQVAEPIGSKSKSSSTLLKIKTEGRFDDRFGNSAFNENATHQSSTSMEYYEMGNTQGNKPIKKQLGLKKSSQSPHQSTIQFNVQPNSIDTLVKKEPSIEVVDLVDVDDTDVPTVETSEDPETSLPFTYLSQVLKDQPFFEERTFRVKGYVSTLVSHTPVSDVSQRWKVIVKVNDGSASIDAALGEEVLTELLGTPLESFQYAMIEAKKSRDPAKCQALQQQTVQFQKKLSQISCLMDVLFSPTEPNPLIIRLTEASRDDILGLISRLGPCK